MKKCFLLLFVFGLSHHLVAQDTLRTKYPDSEKVWEKVYDGKKKVEETVFYEDGSTWMTARYDANKVANWKWYHDNGNPYFEALIVDDLLQGTYKIWYKNGQLAEELTFKDNLENGLARFYHHNGQLAMKGQYANGQMVGDWSFFDENGEPVEGNWTWPFAASPEQNRMEGIIANQKRVGQWTYRTTGGNRKGPIKVFKEALNSK